MVDFGNIKFEIKQVESDDPEKINILIKFPDGLPNDIEGFIKYLENEVCKSFEIQANKLWLGDQNG
jgi:diphthamide synthase subunit DPH2